MPLLDRVFAATYDLLMTGPEGAGLAERRRTLLGALAGHVVEIGAGTGANLPAYGEEVTHLTLLEPTAEVVARLRRRLSRTPVPAQVEVIAAPAEALPLPDRSADAIVSTLVLCTVHDLDRSLDEIERVLRPGGQLVLIEHVAATDPATARLQRRLKRPWAVVGRGCQLDRDPRAALTARGWDVRHLEEVDLPLPAPTRAGQVGTATR